MQRIESTADLDKLRDQERAVVFLWVNWAIHALHSANIAERMIAEWNREHPNADIDLLQIDVSEQSGDIWDAVAVWFESQHIPDVGSLMYGGAGSIIWVRSGTIMQYVINANTETLDGLLALMSQSFGTPEMNKAK